MPSPERVNRPDAAEPATRTRTEAHSSRPDIPRTARKPPLVEFLPEKGLVFAEFPPEGVEVRKGRRIAGALVFNNEGQILLIRTSSGRWGFPKGGVERKERLGAAARRETREEVGIELRGLRPLGTTVTFKVTKDQSGWRQERGSWFLARAGKAAPGDHPDRREMRWVSPEEAATLFGGDGAEPDTRGFVGEHVQHTLLAAAVLAHEDAAKPGKSASKKKTKGKK